MVKFTVQELMDRKDNIRNVSVVAQVGHGKSTLTDSLVVSAGLTAQEVAGNVCMTDTNTSTDEAEHDITIKSTGISLRYLMSDESLKAYRGDSSGNEYLINLIDTPGHADFSHEVTSAVRITDGALIVVDSNEGVCIQTETVIRQALAERIRPVLTINKMDRCFLERQLDGEEAYQMFNNVIKNVNAIISTYEDALLGDVQVYPEKGTVAFSAGLHGWSFTLTNFAKMYAAKFGVDESKMMKRLWGENFFDTERKKWTTQYTGSVSCKRGFVQFCYEPIQQIINTCLNNQKDKLHLRLQTLGLTLKDDEEELTGEALMKRVMQYWLPTSTLLEMMIYHLPSPAKAQKYRVGNLYSGPLDDAYANSIRNCDPNGPLMLYVSKMIPASDKGRFYALGRVFSGNVSTGMKVRIMGPKYVPGQKKDLYFESVQKISIWMGKKQESMEDVEDVPCGGIVAMAGLDQCITKNATLTNEEGHAFPIRAMKFSASPVMYQTVTCTNPRDLPNLIEGLKCLEKSDPMVVCPVEESGQRIVAGAGQIHLENCIKNLEDFMGDAHIIVSPPMISFRETVLEKSSRTVISMSHNKHNRFHMEARPLEVGLADAIDEGHIGPRDDPRARSKILCEEFGWDKDLAKKIWCFGPKTTGPNMLIDTCRGAQYLDEIHVSIVAAFQWATQDGALCQFNMRGICFDLCDVVLHEDAAYRGYGEIIPTVRHAMHASQLNAKPRLFEPIYLLDFQAPMNEIYGISKTIEYRRGAVFEKKPVPDNPLVYNIKAHLPVQESVGYHLELQEVMAGKVYPIPQAVFDHWEIYNSDPMTVGSCAASLVEKIRKRKGLEQLVMP